MRKVSKVRVLLTPLKARIFDAVRRAGAGGVDLTEVMGSKRSRDCLKAHVWQINQVLAPVGLRIVAAKAGTGTGEWRYTLCKLQKITKSVATPLRWSSASCARGLDSQKEIEKHPDWLLKRGRPKKKRNGNGRGNG